MNNLDRMYPVVEIFKSIEGEGIRTGLPAVFIRFGGCNLNCTYCDTPYGQTTKEAIFMTKEEIANRIFSYGCKLVTFTGGEPLLQGEFIKWFANNHCNLEINIETNGSQLIRDFTGFNNIIITMDYKCLSSGCTDKMQLSNFSYLRKQDVLKFVVGTDEDLDQVDKIMYSYKPSCHVYISPVFGKMDLQHLAMFVNDRHFMNLRMGLQIHKIIWDPNTRGV